MLRPLGLLRVATGLVALVVTQDAHVFMSENVINYNFLAADRSGGTLQHARRIRVALVPRGRGFRTGVGCPARLARGVIISCAPLLRIHHLPPFYQRKPIW